MDRRRAILLERMGITRWELRAHDSGRTQQNESGTHSTDRVATQSASQSATQLPSIDTENASLQELRHLVAACTRCDLHQSRTQTVFGVGNPAADWMFIGEAPGEQEDRQGEPFVGRAGQLLDAILQSIGLDRKTAYIANILKCRPPGNRDPHVDEIAACGQYLARQIALVNPRLIVCVGRVAAQSLLGSDATISRLRGTVHRYGDAGIPVIATYHPAYLLRKPSEKRKVWQDLKRGLGVMRELRP